MNPKQVKVRPIVGMDERYPDSGWGVFLVTSNDAIVMEQFICSSECRDSAVEVGMRLAKTLHVLCACDKEPPVDDLRGVNLLNSEVLGDILDVTTRYGMGVEW